jgi:PLD-like domain
MPFVDESLSQLIADDLLSLSPSNDRKQRLSLSEKGKKALDGAETLVPEERAHTIEFDAILQKVVRHGREQLLTSRQARDRGYKQIRPLLKKQIGISDLPLRDVQKSFSEGISKRETRRTILAVCELYRKNLYFLPAICVIYRAIDGPDVQVSFVVDGKHSPQHDQAFAQADGTHLLHIDRDLTRFGNDAENFEMIEQEVREALNKGVASRITDQHGDVIEASVRSVADPESWSLLTAEQKLELQQAGLTYLDAQDHYPVLLHALKTAKYRLLIHTPFLHELIVTDEFVMDLERLLKSGCKVYIGYGMPESDVQKPSKSHLRVVERLEKIARRYSNFLFKKVDSHAKVLLQDELFVVLGSFNWLSFRGDPDRAFRDEQSALIALPSMVERKFQSELRLFA